MIALPLLDLIPRTNMKYALKLSNPQIKDGIHQAISVIKKRITSAPALALPEKGNFEYLIRTGASGFAQLELLYGSYNGMSHFLMRAS